MFLNYLLDENLYFLLFYVAGFVSNDRGILNDFVFVKFFVLWNVLCVMFLENQGESTDILYFEWPGTDLRNLININKLLLLVILFLDL